MVNFFLRLKAPCFRAQVETRFSHSDQRMESIRDFCSARLESINESCSSLEKDLLKLKETFRDEQKVQLREVDVSSVGLEPKKGTPNIP